MIAAMHGQEAVARVLIEAGADVDAMAEKSEGYTALFFAAQTGSSATVDALLRPARTSTRAGWTAPRR